MVVCCCRSCSVFGRDSGVFSEVIVFWVTDSQDWKLFRFCKKVCSWLVLFSEVFWFFRVRCRFCYSFFIYFCRWLMLFFCLGCDFISCSDLRFRVFVRVLMVVISCFSFDNFRWMVMTFVRFRLRFFVDFIIFVLFMIYLLVFS